MTKKKITRSGVVIQDLEEYLEEIGMLGVELKPDVKAYKELNETKNYKQDDVLSVTPGLASAPYTRFYASLLTAKYEQTAKEELEKLKKIMSEYEEDIKDEEIKE